MMPEDDGGNAGGWLVHCTSLYTGLLLVHSAIPIANIRSEVAASAASRFIGCVNDRLKRSGSVTFIWIERAHVLLREI